MKNLTELKPANNSKPRKKLIGKSKISPKYQIVIPKEIRHTLKNVEPGKEVYITPIDKNSMRMTLKEESWVEKYGGILPKGYYGEDATDYIRKLRDEWDK